MKKISFLLIAVFLVLSTSGSYGYFKYIYEDDDSSSDKPTIQEEIIEEETNKPANNQTSNNTEEQSEEDDLEFERDGVKLLVDSMSFQYLMGSEIDFIDDLMGTRFVVSNPNATTTCGCGSSFAV